MPRLITRLRGSLSQQGRFGNSGNNPNPPDPVDSTPPVITSATAFSVNEKVAFNTVATANEFVTWTLGGTDKAIVVLNADTGAWSVPAQTYASKKSVVFTLTATDSASNKSTVQTVTLTIKQVVTDPGTDWTKEPTGGSLDMTGWNVSIPVANSSGTATTIEPATEAAITKQASTIPVATVHKFFQVFPGYVDFLVTWDAVIVTSKNTTYPRSELRELIFDGTAWNDNEWQASTGTHQQDVTVCVKSLTLRADGNYAMTDIGQIHGASNEICRLAYRPIENGGTKGEICYYNDKWNTASGAMAYPSDDPNQKASTSTAAYEGNVVLRKGGLASGAKATVDLNEVFSYRIYVTNNTLTVSAWIKGELYSHSQVLHPYWKDDKCYFKAGNYRQANKTKTDANRKAVSGTTWVRVFNCVKTHSADTKYYS